MYHPFSRSLYLATFNPAWQEEWNGTTYTSVGAVVIERTFVSSESQVLKNSKMSSNSERLSLKMDPMYWNKKLLSNQIYLVKVKNSNIVTQNHKLLRSVAARRRFSLYPKHKTNKRVSHLFLTHAGGRKTIIQTTQPFNWGLRGSTNFKLIPLRQLPKGERERA